METHKPPVILFWGTSEFAVPALDALLRAGYSIAGVVSTPDKPVGRKRVLTPPPVKAYAVSHGIPVYQPETLRPAGYTLELPDVDLFITAAYGKIIPKEILKQPRLGALNIHPSILPRWRGPSPIQFTILSGDTETGVTIIKMDELMDHGPIIAQKRLNIQKIPYTELHEYLAQLGAELLIEILPKWILGEITPVAQDQAKATFSRMLTKEDGRIDWGKSAQELERRIRAFTPWPSSWTLWPKNNRQYRVRIDEADVAGEDVSRGLPGYVFQREAHPLCIQTGKGVLAVKRLTLEGGETLAADAFLRGHPDILGSTFV